MLKRALRFIGLLLLFSILFRGPLYRSLISYRPAGQRAIITLTDAELLMSLAAERSGGKLLEPEQISATAQHIATRHLQFTFAPASANPNRLAKSGRANCIGYAALTAALARQIISNGGTTNRYTVTHRVGKLLFLGFDVHGLLHHPFFRDHDYVEVNDRETGETTAIDPSLNDYFRIDKIRVGE